MTEQEFLVFNFVAHTLDAQLEKCIEEAGELITAIAKYRLNKNTDTFRDVLSELVDWAVLAAGFQEMYPEEFNAIWDYKVGRQAMRMGKTIEREDNIPVHGIPLHDGTPLDTPCPSCGSVMVIPLASYGASLLAHFRRCGCSLWPEDLEKITAKMSGGKQ